MNLVLLLTHIQTMNAEGNWEESDVTLYSQKGNVEGYYDFYCRFDFDNDGNFKSVGVWE